MISRLLAEWHSMCFVGKFLEVMKFALVLCFAVTVIEMVVT